MNIIISTAVFVICVVRTTAYIIYEIKNKNKAGGISTAILLLAALFSIIYNTMS